MPRKSSNGVRIRCALVAVSAVVVAGCAAAPGHGDPPTSALSTSAALQATARLATPDPHARLSSDGRWIDSGPVQIFVDAAQGLSLGHGKSELGVALPNSQLAGIGRADGGTVVYPIVDHVANVVVATGDGVQMVSVIHSPHASETFDYPVALPPGGRIALTMGPSADGGPGALVLDGHGAAVTTIDAPWAVDARGVAVPTSFSTNGTTLTQHVHHRGLDTAYPVVADPHFRWYDLGVVITLTYDDTVAFSIGGIQALQAMVPSVAHPLGAAAAATLAAITADAAWGVATRNCLWIWLPYPGVLDTPDYGHYEC